MAIKLFIDFFKQNKVEDFKLETKHFENTEKRSAVKKKENCIHHQYFN